MIPLESLRGELAHSNSSRDRVGIESRILRDGRGYTSQTGIFGKIHYEDCFAPS